MTDVWRLHQWLQRAHPATLDMLAPGLMQVAITSYEKELAVTFPAGLVEAVA